MREGQLRLTVPLTALRLTVHLFSPLSPSLSVTSMHISLFPFFFALLSLHVQLRWIKPPRPGWFNFFFSFLFSFSFLLSFFSLSVSFCLYLGRLGLKPLAGQREITSLPLFTFIIPKQHRITLLIHMDIKAYAHIKAKTYNAPLNTNFTVRSKTANPYFQSLTSSLATFPLSRFSQVIKRSHDRLSLLLFFPMKKDLEQSHKSAESVKVITARAL